MKEKQAIEEAPEVKTDLDELIRDHSDSYQQWMSSRRSEIASVIRLSVSGSSKPQRPIDK
jgi:hypothetical protein